MASLAAALPIPLITALTERRLWPPAQALAYARQLPDPGRRASALTALRPLLPPDQQHPVLAEALTAARQITHGDYRAKMLAALARSTTDLPHLRASTLLQEVLPVLV